MNRTRLIAQLQVDEGFSPVAFWDNEQFSYGFGCRAEKVGDTITEEAALELLKAEAEEAIADFEDIYAHCRFKINDVRAEALCNMAFNLGKTKLMKFRKMNAAIGRNDWLEAAYQAQESAWYGQVGNRAKRIVKELSTGEKA
jgi:lysozyme